MQSTSQVRKKKAAALTEAITFCVKPQTKTRYDILCGEPHNIMVADHLREVLARVIAGIFADLENLKERYESFKPQKPAVAFKRISMWITKECDLSYAELRDIHPEIPRTEMIREAFEKEIDRLWELEQLPPMRAAG